jgi:hypothetical protein
MTVPDARKDQPGCAGANVTEDPYGNFGGLSHHDGLADFLRPVLTVVLLVLLVLSLGCTKKPSPDGYRVLSYEATTHQWVILRTGTFDGKYLTKRLIIVCSLYKWGDHEPVTGPDACHLQVGRLIIPNPMPATGKHSDFLEVSEMPDEILSIVEGEGAERVSQQFSILKYEVLPDNANQ